MAAKRDTSTVRSCTSLRSQSLFVASVLGLIFAQYSFAYHLLHIAEFNQLVNRAIKAVTKNGNVCLQLQCNIMPYCNVIV